MTGSATLVSWLLREGLLDELHLFVSRSPLARVSGCTTATTATSCR
jgi:hypothetical protein